MGEVYRATDPQLVPSEAGRNDSAGSLTAPGTVVGTVAYMSPEQVRGGRLTEATDLFSLGCVLYEMLAGAPPHVRSSAAETMSAVLRDASPDVAQLVPSVPQRFSTIIASCLAKTPEHRPRSSKELRSKLRSLLDEREDDDQPTALRSVVAPPSRRLALIGAALVALAVAGAGALWLARPQSRIATPVARTIRSIAVLPFENTSRDTQSEFLSDGLTEGLINALARLPNLRVVARTTAFTFKGKPLDLGDIRKKLDVEAVLTGKVITRGINVVVQADLLDTSAGTQLWGERYQQPAENVLALEQDLASAIADHLRPELAPEQQKRVTRQPTQSGEAYALYLKGRYYWNKRNSEALPKAKDYFEEAIRADPAFALAYSGLADTSNILRPGNVDAERFARRALELQPELAEAHASLGLVLSSRWEWTGATNALRTAMRLNPSYASAHQWYSGVLLGQGRLEESLREMQTAQRLDPLAPIMMTNTANRLIALRDFPAALVEANKALEMDPQFRDAHAHLGLAYEGMKRYEDAKEAYQKVASLPVRPFVLADASLARMMIRSGESRQAREKLATILADARHSRHWWEIAAVYAELDERDNAIQWLEKGFEEYQGLAFYHLRTPMFDRLRDDPRFQQLLRRLAAGKPASDAANHRVAP
ncbi:MAG: protein kinase [Thermoanaerobaculia bacterium]